MNLLNCFKKQKREYDWKFSKSSKRHLNDRRLNKTLRKVVNHALSYCPIQFGVSSGFRTAEEQNALFKKGASKRDGYIKKSQHQYGLAVDVYAIKGGKACWNAESYYPIAAAFQKASKELNIPIRWGGSWHVLKDEDAKPRDLVQEYKARKKRKKQKPFLDLVHFEIFGG